MDCQPFPIDRLPIELAGNVLAQLDSPLDLAACLEASPVLWHAYNEMGPTKIALQVARNSFSNNEAEFNAAMAIVTFPSTDGLDRVQARQMITNHLQRLVRNEFTDDPKLDNPGSLFDVHRAAIFCTHRVVTAFAHDYVRRALGEKPDYPTWDLAQLLEKMGPRPFSTNRCAREFSATIETKVRETGTRRLFLIYELFSNAFGRHYHVDDGLRVFIQAELTNLILSILTMHEWK